MVYLSGNKKKYLSIQFWNNEIIFTIAIFFYLNAKSDLQKSIDNSSNTLI